MAENPYALSDERGRLQRTGMYAAVACMTVVALIVGFTCAESLRDKIYIFCPVFLIIILIMFYGLVSEPKPNMPTRIQRYAMRPHAVNELAKLLKTSSTGLAGERLYGVSRSVICRKLDLKPESPDEEIINATQAKFPRLSESVGTFLKGHTTYARGEKKITSEKEFIEHYNRILGILYSFDGKIWRCD
jgi:hypothetical protein